MNKISIENTNIDFVCAGFPKGRTTWLYEKLLELPDFSMPLQKEIHFFDRSNKYSSSRHLEETFLKNRIVKQKKWILKQTAHTIFKVIKLDFSSAKFFNKWYFSNYDNNWYLSLFSNRKGITGDISRLSWMKDEVSDLKMSKVLPSDIKLIFVMRNPIDRAWSHFRMIMRKRKKLNLSDYSNKEIKEFLDSEGQLGRTNYNVAIERYQKFFPNNSIYITFYDELESNPIGFLENMVSFLKGNPNNVVEFCKIEKRVKQSIKAEIPIELNEFLENQYYELILDLSSKYGGYCTKWLSMIDSSIKTPAKEELKPYFILK